MNDYAKLGEVLDALVEASEFLDNYVDVDDGDYGEPRPNRAMSVQTSVESAIVQVIHLRERINEPTIPSAK